MRCWRVLLIGVCVAALESASAEPPSDLSDDPLPAGAILRLGSVRFHPPSSVSDLALSPDGKTVISVGEQLIAWDAETGKQLWQADRQRLGFKFRGTGYDGGEIAFSSDSFRFYTPGGDNHVLTWDARSGHHDVLVIDLPKPKLQTRHNGITSVDVTADDKRLAVGSDSGLAVCTRQGELLFYIENTRDGPEKIDNNDRLTFSGPYSYGRFSPDGKLLAAVMSGRPDELLLHDAQTGDNSRKIHLAARLVRFDFSPDSTRIAVTERDNAVRLYEVHSRERIWSQVITLTNPYENYTSAIAFSPDGKIIAAGATDHRIYLFEPARGEPMAQLVGHSWYPWALAFTADSKLLYSSGWDGAIRRWDVATRKQLELPAGVRGSGVVAASPDGHLLAYVDDAETIRLVDAKTVAERRNIALSGTAYSHLAFSADGRRLAGSGSSGDNVHVAVWNVDSGELVHRWNWPKGRDPYSTAESVCFSPDGNRLAANVFRQSTAYIWDLTTGQQIAELPHKGVYGLSFSPDGNTLATAGWDKILRFWESDTGQLRQEFTVAGKDNEDARIYAVRFAPRGGLIATAHLDGTVRIWQGDNMSLRTQFRPKSRFLFGAIDFSRDGLWLATGDCEGHVELWDPLTGANVWNKGQHRGHVYTVSFGRDNRTVVSGGSGDGVCYLWDLRADGEEPPGNVDQLWEELSGDDGIAAYRAMWALASMPDRSVTYLAEKLRPVTSLVDPNRQEDSTKKTQRSMRLAKLLAEKDPTVELEIAVRRAVSVLAQAGTPEAVKVLQELAEGNPAGDVGRLASTALGPNAGP